MRYKTVNQGFTGQNKQKIVSPKSLLTSHDKKLTPITMTELLAPWKGQGKTDGAKVYKTIKPKVKIPAQAPPSNHSVMQNETIKNVSYMAAPSKEAESESDEVSDKTNEVINRAIYGLQRRKIADKPH